MGRALGEKFLTPTADNMMVVLVGKMEECVAQSYVPGAENLLAHNMSVADFPACCVHWLFTCDEEVNAFRAACS